MAIVATSANAWQSLFSFNEPGPYIVRLDAKWGDKTEELNLPVFVKTPLDEKSNLSADPDFAEAFAVAAGGRRIEYGELEKTVLDSAADHAMNALESESVWMPKWCRWWFLSLILLFLGAEYFVRRRGGLL